MVRAIGVLAVTCSLGAFPLLSGCGDGGAGPAAFVPVAATVETAAFSLERITLTAGAGDRLEAGGVTAWIERPDGSRDDVDVSPSGDGRSLTLGRAAVTVSEAGETRGQAAPQADVRVLATVEANTRGQIDGITLAALDPLDTFDITGAHAHVWQPDGATAPVAMDVSADATEVTLGSFPVEPPPGTGAYWRLNRLVITGPVWVIDGATDSRTQIGALGFSFGVNDNDEVVAPTTVQACIPTLGAASDRRVVCEGLDPTDYVWVAIADAYGGLTHSRAYLPDANGR
ncbi:MAG: hypothetical protein FJX74_18170, partial [Armatimonadetes bacterium]|nr:hypothetical protein [Armatimonadota bacterium]